MGFVKVGPHRGAHTEQQAVIQGQDAPVMIQQAVAAAVQINERFWSFVITSRVRVDKDENTCLYKPV